MSQPYHTKSDDAWSSDVLALLPSDLDASAREHGAFTRVRAFADPSQLLRGLLTYACSEASLRAVGVWGVLMDVADIAAPSWRERLQTSAPWLQALVAQVLQQPRPCWLTQVVRGRVLLVDATSLRWQGGTGNDQRLHLAYDLLAGQFAQVVSTDGHAAEHLRHFLFRPLDLVVFDGGYGYRDRFAHLQDQQADGIGRIYPPTFPLETADGQRLDVRAWLDSHGASQRSRVAYYTHAGRRRAVRLLATRLYEPLRQAAGQRARTRARKRQRPVGELASYYADWMLLVTTLLDEESWPDAAIWRLYGARWQIELVFKGLKQFLEMDKLRWKSLESASAVVWARLLVWVLHEPLRRQLGRRLQELAQPQPTTYPGQRPQGEAVVSEWSCCGLLLSTLVQAIRGSWTLARIEECLPRLGRFLVSHPRQDREHQASEVRAWLTGQRLTPARPLSNAL